MTFSIVKIDRKIIMNTNHKNRTRQVATNKQPTVSVVVITYNQVKYIRKSIEGILSQKTDFEYELIIGEDCSTDRTRDICIQYSQESPEKIRLLLHQQNIGMHQNVIQTLRSARGKYIAF